MDTGARIPNAKVWLQQPDGFGGWENVSTGLAIADPDVNPLTTGSDGQYQWDVIGGIYRVHVEALDYYPKNSSFVSVPPPVTDLHVGLKHFPDVATPETVTDLHNITFAPTYINWTWADPGDTDLDHVEVYINSTFKENAPKGKQYFNATLLFADTECTISTRTVDSNGNVNLTWENRTAKTAAASVPPESTPPVITNVSVSGIGTDSADISWQTDEASNSSVGYGKISGSNTSLFESTDMEISHSLSLTGLIPETKYYYMVRSSDANGNSVQGTEFNFTTLALFDMIDPTIDSVVVYPANTTAGSTVDIKVAASDNKEVTEVTADGYAFTYSDGYWNGNITASSTPGTYNVIIMVKDAACNDAQTTVKYTVVNKVGGIAITSMPKPLSIVRGSSGQLNIKLISTANIDDSVWVNITTTGISPTSAINLGWFNRTAVLVEVPSKATAYVPFRVTVPSDAVVGYKTFKNNAKSLGFNATSVDTGMVNVR